MYAVVSRWPMDPSQQDLQNRVLHEQIVPMVKQAPGLVSGYWGRAANGSESVSFHVFQDEAAAKGFAATVNTDPEDREQYGVESPSWQAIVKIEATA